MLGSLYGGSCYFGSILGVPDFDNCHMLQYYMDPCRQTATPQIDLGLQSVCIPHKGTTLLLLAHAV